MHISIRARLRRLLPSLALDASLVFLAYLLALLLRFEGEVPETILATFRLAAVPIVLVYVLVNYVFGLYNRFWPYASAGEVGVIWGAVAVGTSVVGAWDILIGFPRSLPLSVVVLGGTFTVGLLTVQRYRWRLVTGFLWRLRAARSQRTQVLIVGAGEAGQLLAWQLKNQASTYEVVGFIDDDAQKKGMRVHGARVLGNRSAIVPEAASKAVDVIVIAIHTISGQEFRDILARCQETRAQIKVLPNVFHLMNSTVVESALRDIAVEDLLGRQMVPMDQDACHRLLAGKTVLVTGAAGSIGAELSRMILRFQPARLVLLDNNESGLYDLELDLTLSAPEDGIVQTVVGDILRTEKMKATFASYRPEIVFHCAAYKHVPLMEAHPDEAFLVNVVGTRDVLFLAEQYGAERFVLISSDKAVGPTSVMGMTKRLCEFLITMDSSTSHCRRTVVRFGNVLNSRGSVVPTFLRQLEMGGPVTVTDPRMTRYFMGPLEAVSLILQAAALTEGGDIFVLDMGEEIRIVDLARRLIRLRGLRVGEDVEITYTGPRPGEKLHEKLVEAPYERKRPTAAPYIFKVQGAQQISRSGLLAEVDALEALAREGKREDIRARLHSGMATSYDFNGVPQEGLR